jgi:hypothetical protein
VITLVLDAEEQKVLLSALDYGAWSKEVLLYVLALSKRIKLAQSFLQNGEESVGEGDVL